jgi:hypothetical protein
MHQGSIPLRVSVLAVAAFAISVAATAPAQTVSIPGIFNTGVDGSGTPLAPGSLE